MERRATLIRDRETFHQRKFARIAKGFERIDDGRIELLGVRFAFELHEEFAALEGRVEEVDARVLFSERDRLLIRGARFAQRLFGVLQVFLCARRSRGDITDEAVRQIAKILRRAAVDERSVDVDRMTTRLGGFRGLGGVEIVFFEGCA